MKSKILFPLAILVLTACSGGESGDDAPGIDLVAREYLFLELSMGLHDPGHVDAYFGPEEIRDTANKTRLAVDEIGERVDALKRQVDALPAATDELEQMRIDGLVGRFLALETRIAMMMGENVSFDEESRRLFGAAAPDHNADYFQAILDEIDELIGGEGPLSERAVAFRDQFVVPQDKLADVFDAAIAECRRRTLHYIDLPENESFTLEYVNDKPWSGYNWYQGNSQSLIQINTDLPILISRAVDLGCHEGYPGHHTFNALLEKNLVVEKGWLEFSLYPLFSPQSLIAEGSGNYGIDLAFPGEERISFEREVLFPLAGLDSANADRFYELLELLARLDYAGNEAARDYLNGTISRSEAVQWLVDYALTSPERARQRTDFFDTYRSYVINYNLGKDIVRTYIERDGAGEAQRWARFEQMLSSPVTAADLQ